MSLDPELWQFVALGILGVCALVQSRVNRRLHRRLWDLEGDLGRMMARLGLVGRDKREEEP